MHKSVRFGEEGNHLPHTPAGPVRKGGRLIEKRQPDQRHKVLDAIAKRQQHTELNPKVPLSMSEMGR
ncbi:MAG: hypothetical protein P8X89_22880 [Reinekea sp.]